MWTIENRARYKRDQLRYPSDVTEEEWGDLAALIPPAFRGRFFPECSRGRHSRESGNPGNIAKRAGQNTGCQPALA